MAKKVEKKVVAKASAPKKHRLIARSIFNTSFYKGLKAKSKKVGKFHALENAFFLGLHLFEWLVIVLLGALVTISVLSIASSKAANGYPSIFQTRLDQARLKAPAPTKVAPKPTTRTTRVFGR